MATRTAWLEVISGIATFTIALLTWVIWLFAPLHAMRGMCDQQACPHILYVSRVDGLAGLGDFIRFFPSVSLFILAFLVVTAAIAWGAYLHGRRGVSTGRLLIWGGSFLLPLGVSAISAMSLTSPFPVFGVAFRPAITMSALSVLPQMFTLPVQVWFGPPIGPDTLILGVGLGLCAALALIASVAAMHAEDARRQSRERGRREGAMAARPARLEVICGVATFAIALLTWAIWLFAPLYAVRAGCTPFACYRSSYVSLVSEVDGLDGLVRLLPSISLLILVFLVVAGAEAAGAYLHGRRGVPTGRLLVWGGSVLLPLGVSAISALPLMLMLPFELERVPPYTVGWYTPILSVGPSLCAVLALIASLAAMRAEDARRSK